MFERFIPPSGATQYVQSEVYRAGLRLHHDYFNNGFGNNMSEAVAYIEKYHLPLASAEFIEAFAAVREQALAPTGDDSLDEYITTMAAELLTRLAGAARAGTLVLATEEIFDMPRVETIYPEEENWDEDEDEELAD